MFAESNEIISRQFIRARAHFKDVSLVIIKFDARHTNQKIRIVWSIKLLRDFIRCRFS